MLQTKNITLAAFLLCALSLQLAAQETPLPSAQKASLTTITDASLYLDHAQKEQKRIAGKKRKDNAAHLCPDTPHIGVGSFWGDFRSSHQDAEVVRIIGSHTLLGVYDGHGGAPSVHMPFSLDRGLCVSSFAAMRMPELFAQGLHTYKDHKQLFTDAHALIDKEIERFYIGNRKAGSTAVSALIDDKNNITFAHAGDSRALLIDKDGNILFATKDHKPYTPEEWARLKALGGYVYGKRVLGQLAVSRSFGDFSLGGKDGKKLITAEPEVSFYKEVPQGSILLLACDGVWDKYRGKKDSEQNRAVAAHLVAAKKQGLSAQHIAESFKDFGDISRDNTTAIVYLF